MPDLQRVFEYHGAEHKTISCYEAGEALTPENAQRFSRFHPRCGTSFLLLVMIVAIVVFAPLGKLDWHWLFISRIVGIPIVAGLAFELIKWFGKNRTKRWARVLMWPGIQLQRLTTREPDLSRSLRWPSRRSRPCSRSRTRVPPPRRTRSAWKSLRRAEAAGLIGSASKGARFAYSVNRVFGCATDSYPRGLWVPCSSPAPRVS